MLDEPAFTTAIASAIMFSLLQAPLPVIASSIRNQRLDRTRDEHGRRGISTTCENDRNDRLLVATGKVLCRFLGADDCQGRASRVLSLSALREMKCIRAELTSVILSIQ